jgi:hypothetical protein
MESLHAAAQADQNVVNLFKLTFEVATELMIVFKAFKKRQSCRPSLLDYHEEKYATHENYIKTRGSACMGEMSV